MHNRHFVDRIVGKPALVLAATAVAAALLGHASPARAQADQFHFYFSDANAIGGFAYDAANDVFYKANFSPNQGFTKFTPSAGTYAGTIFVGPTDMTTYSQSSSLAGNGSLPSTPSGGTPTFGDMMLNPATITLNRDGVNYTYNPGTIAYIVSQTGIVNSNSVAQPALTKFGFWYDLRQATPAASTAVGPDRNGNGKSDWNDVFENSVSLADLQAVQGSAATSATIGRRFAFSSDGQAVYFNDSGANFGGIWKATITGTPVVSKVVNSLSGSRINTEPGVVASTVRDFGGGAGDQLMFQGSTDTGNIGGVNYVVDNGATASPVKTLLTAKQMSAFFDVNGVTGDVSGITADSDGNIYLSNGSNPNGLFIYDTQGRLAKVASDAEHRVFQATKGTSFQSTILDTKVRSAVVPLTGGGTATLNEVMYSDSASTLRAPVGITVYKPGDFNRDNVVDSTDVNQFKAVLGLRGAVVAGIGRSTPFTQTNTSNLKFDLNGSSTSGTGTLAVEGVAIDWKDVKIFQQFAGLSDGDANMDFVVNSTDLNTIGGSYNGANDKLFTNGNLTSVRIDAPDKDTVNFADLVTLAANWTSAKPALGPVGSISQTDLDRAFAITASGTISEYVARGSGTWSNPAAWSNSVVPNSAGAVASLLTKPFDDVTLDVDGSYTIGQLNFDNYFSYTLNGTGTLHLQGANGPAAEINAFAASPTISAGVSVDSNASLTITYASDTITLSGPFGIAASQTMTKQGPGRLVISGAQSHGAGSALAVNAGTLDMNSSAAAARPGALSLSVGSGATINFNATQRLSTLTVNNGGVANLIASGSRVLVTESLTVAGTGTLDLADNDAVIGAGTTKSTVEGLIASARNGGAWNLPGITSSAAKANASGTTNLGVLSGAEYSAFGNGAGTFSGEPYSSGDTLVKYTWNGDTNFSGTVNFDDYVRVDVGYNTSLSGWGNGDFNYSGTVDFDDYVMIDVAFNTQSGTLSRAVDYLSGDDRSDIGLGSPGLQEVIQHFEQFGVPYAAAFLAAVPEPTMLGCVVMITAAALQRRRRR